VSWRRWRATLAQMYWSIQRPLSSKQVG
jgi:hypothetical protein